MNSTKNMDKIDKLLHINNHPLFDIDINPDGWIMPSKIKFNKNWIEKTFKYKLDTREVNKCSKCSDGKCSIVNSVSLFPYQKFVKDYIQYESPYRGILLYMGVGMGKSCTSIAAAEIFLNNENINMGVIIMSPASLRSNYIQEIKKCGRKFFQKNQHWIRLNIQNASQLEKERWAKTLKLNQRYFSNKEYIWIALPNKKEPNYETLAEGAKKEIQLQMDDIIYANFEFINYNGLRLKRTEKNKNKETNNSVNIGIKKNTYISDMIKNGNPFDNKCIIVDEIHNLVSRIINKGKVGNALYKLLMSAKNCKLILLSGTPIINYPYEIGYIINLLTGINYYYIFKVKETNINIQEMLNQIPYIDVIEIDNMKKEIKIKLLPEGFMYIDRKKLKVGRYEKKQSTLDNKQILDLIKVYLKDKKITSIIIKDYKLFPEDNKEFNDLFINEEKAEIKNKKLLGRKSLGVVSYYSNYDKKLYPEVKINEIYLKMSDEQFVKYEKVRSEERKKERATSLFGSSSSVYRAYSRAYGNFVFPEQIDRPFPSDKKELNEEDEENDKDKEYIKRINNALKKLSTSKNNYLLPDNLKRYSPKMYKVLEELKKGKKALIYTQFRKVEGIGIMKLVLEKNGWSEFKIKKVNNVWIVHEDSMNNKPKFISFDGNTEETQLLLKIYNMDKSSLPQELVDSLDFNKKSIIDILMITVSGAEGISLKQVRQVHILEPYWNYIRIDQVIGRAVRMCSHTDLPEEERNVEVFIYNIQYTEEQIKSSFTIQAQDKSLTTDEYIYNLAKKKNKIITQILDVIKGSAVDCPLNTSAHKIKCYSFPVNIEEDKNVNNVYDDEEYIEKNEWKGYILNTKKGVFIVNPNTNDVYDYEIYINSNKLVKLGKLVTMDNGKKAIKN